MRFATLISILFCCSVFTVVAEPATGANEVRPLLEGMKVPDVKVTDTDGAPFSLKALLMQKPSVVVFYRGGWCPYCSAQLAGLKDIEKPLTEAGYQILAVSPQSLKQLNDQKLEEEFAARLLADSELSALNGFGISYYVDDETASKYDSYNIALTKDSTGKAVLPAPAVFIVDKKGVVQFSYVNPDYTVRPSSELILAAAQALAE